MGYIWEEVSCAFCIWFPCRVKAGDQADRAACVHNLMFCGAVMNCAVGVCLQVSSAVINHCVDWAHERCSVFSSR